MKKAGKFEGGWDGPWTACAACVPSMRFEVHTWMECRNRNADGGLEVTASSSAVRDYGDSWASARLGYEAWDGRYEWQKLHKTDQMCRARNTWMCCSVVGWTTNGDERPAHGGVTYLLKEWGLEDEENAYRSEGEPRGQRLGGSA